jgi:hypothetical protein
MGFSWTASVFVVAILGLLNVVTCAGGNMPAQWWKATHARPITSLADLKTFI